MSGATRGIVAIAAVGGTMLAVRYLPRLVAVVRSTRVLLAMDISSVIQPTKSSGGERA